MNSYEDEEEEDGFFPWAIPEVFDQDLAIFWQAILVEFRYLDDE